MPFGVPGGKKSTPCRFFLQTGTCNFGDDCQFLHHNPSVEFQKQLVNGPLQEKQGAISVIIEILHSGMPFLKYVLWSLSQSFLERALSPYCRFLHGNCHCLQTCLDQCRSAEKANCWKNGENMIISSYFREKIYNICTWLNSLELIFIFNKFEFVNPHLYQLHFYEISRTLDVII